MEIRLATEEINFSELEDTEDAAPELFDGYQGDEQPEKIVTLRDVIEAVRANGIPHVRGIWFDIGEYQPATNTYEVKGGCAVAQAARNLGVDPTYLQDLPVVTEIINLNDNEEEKLTLDQIADKMLEKHADDLDEKYVTHTADYSQGVPEYIYDHLVGA